MMPSKTPRIIIILEWALISFVVISQLLMINRLKESIGLIFIGLAIFSGLGMWRSPKKIFNYTNTIVQCFIITAFTIWGKIYSYQLLFLVVVIRSCLILRGFEQFVVSGCVFVSTCAIHSYRLANQQLPLQLADNQPEFIWLNLNLLFGLLIFSFQLLVDKILVEEQNKQELAIANQRLRDYALRVEELATVKERNRIAREIHDSLGHSLTVFNLYLEAALRLLSTDQQEAETLIREAKQVGTKILAEVRESVTTLRSDPLDGISLLEAIHNLTTEFQRSTGVLTQTEIILDTPPPQILAITIFRIIQESLTNICKHAEANNVSINLIQSTDIINLTISDNGKGFDLANNMTGFGLQGMKERTIALSGELEIITAPQHGCKLKARIPILVL